MLPHRFSVQLKENNICAACSCWRWHPPQCGSSSPLALRSSGCSAAWEQPAAAAGGFLLSSEPVPLCLGTALLKGMELHDGCQCSDTALGLVLQQGHSWSISVPPALSHIPSEGPDQASCGIYVWNGGHRFQNVLTQQECTQSKV